MPAAHPHLVPLDGGLYDPERHVLRRGEAEVRLSKTEARLLDYLVANAGRALRYERLLQDVWGYHERVESRTVYTTVGRLRQKIEADPNAPRHLLAEAGVGYRFELRAVEGASPPRVAGGFVGREEELGRVAGWLREGARVVSVVGTGGTGKTRFVVELLAREGATFPGGAWFCDLSGARDAAGVHAAVAAALRIPLGAADPAVQLGHAIAGRGAALLVLDNAEQVRAEAVAAVEAWRARAPEARWIVTSRELPRLAGEVLLSLEPLALPAPSDAHPERSEAVTLFLLRAREAWPEAAPDPHDAAALVRALDGLPLAIELAAARIRAITPAQMLERMSRRFDLLARGRGAEGRQATLRATIAWSWDLSTPEEQAALAQASVFRGGFSLSAAEAVLATADGWVVDVLQALCERHLLKGVPVADRPGDQRFQLYESVRAYAEEQLGDREAAEIRHGRYFASFGDDAAIDALRGPDGVRLLAGLAAERDNLLAAADRAIARGDEGVALRAAAALCEVLVTHGPHGAIPALSARVRGMPGLDRERVRAEVLHARALGVTRAPEALAALEAALAVARVAGEETRVTALLTEVALLLNDRGRREEALRALDEAIERSRAAGDGLRERHALVNQGIVLQDAGDPARAQACYEQALSLAVAAGDVMAESNARGSLGILHKHQGRLQEAARQYEAALALFRVAGDRRREGIQLMNLGLLLGEMGEDEEGRDRFERALRLARELGQRMLVGVTLGNLGDLHLRRGDTDRAAACLEEALVVLRVTGPKFSEALFRGVLGEVHRRQGHTDAARACLEEALELARRLALPRGEGTELQNLGLLLLDQGRPEQAAAQLREAVAVLRTADAPQPLGVALGHLGVALHACGRVGEALAAFREGEAVLRREGRPAKLALLLCRRGLADLAAGDPRSAWSALEEAEAAPATGLERADRDAAARELREALGA